MLICPLPPLFLYAAVHALTLPLTTFRLEQFAYCRPYSGLVVLICGMTTRVSKSMGATALAMVTPPNPPPPEPVLIPSPRLTNELQMICWPPLTGQSTYMPSQMLS